MERNANVCLIPQRYVISILIGFGIILTYSLRACTGTAMYHAIKRPKIVQDNRTNECNFTHDSAQLITVLDELLDWNQAAQFAIANSFYTTYLLTHVPAGIISDKFGGKYVLGFSILSASIIALLTPKSVQLSGGHYFVMILSRSCSGLALGMIFPSVNSLIANWAPARDRGKLSGFPFAGSQIGLALDQVVTNTLIIQSKTWSSPLYLYGSFGIVWFLVWHLVAASNPRFSRYITAQELDYLKREMEGHITFGNKAIPWFSLLTCCPLWTLIIAQIGHVIMWLIILRDFPIYMKETLRFDIRQSSLWISIPYLCTGFLTVTSGCISDFLINNHYVHVTTARKIFTTFGAMGPPIFALMATFAGCHRFIALFMFTVGLTSMSFYWAGTRVNTLDLAPNFSGVIMGIANAFTVIPSVTLSGIVHKLTPNKTVEEWREVFNGLLVILGFSNIVFLIFGSGEEQDWNNPESDDDDEQ